MLTESQLPPLDPPDSYGKMGHYADLVSERKIRCVHDNDECSFARFCPRYEPQDYFEFKVQEHSNDIVATCKLFSTKEEMEKELFGTDNYENNKDRNRYIDYLFKTITLYGDRNSDYVKVLVKHILLLSETKKGE